MIYFWRTKAFQETCLTNTSRFLPSLIPYSLCQFHYQNFQCNRRTRRRFGYSQNYINRSLDGTSLLILQNCVWEQKVLCKRRQPGLCDSKLSVRESCCGLVVCWRISFNEIHSAYFATWDVIANDNCKITAGDWT